MLASAENENRQVFISSCKIAETGFHKSNAQSCLIHLYQIDQSRSKIGQRGAGLGLSIARQIIEKHHGTIQVVSKLTTGTAIICWLPEGG